MPVSCVGRPKTELDTPVLLVDLDIMDRNIATIAGACRAAGVAWRPHFKGIKVPAISLRAIAAGAIGITCAKLGEAEVAAAAGIRDILIANQIVTPRKIARLVHLRRSADVMVAVDDAGNVAALGAAAAAAGVRLRVLIEVDVGMHRAGVLPGAATVDLARRITATDGLVFAGIMGWEAQAVGIADPAEKQRVVVAAIAQLAASARACADAGLPCGIVSCGGTGTIKYTMHQPGVTEIQAGGGMFSDMRYTTSMHADLEPALTILATVTSRPTPTRIICDAGRKTMSADGIDPKPLGLGKIVRIGFSAEHATIELEAPSAIPAIGDTIEFIAGYGDTTVHLHDTLHGVRGGIVEAEWPVLARGKLA
jgi:D-serine deaminase-like pyridoxal phosphate-dependent protein